METKTKKEDEIFFQLEQIDISIPDTGKRHCIMERLKW